MARKTFKSQMACYLSFNVITLSDEPRMESIPLITLANVWLALRFYLLALLTPARRYQVKVAWLTLEIMAVVALELWRDLLKTTVVNVC